jgi:hypothetical protein
MRIVVDLPAPLGPRNPKTMPAGMARSTESTATSWPGPALKTRRSPAASTTASEVICTANSIILDPGSAEFEARYAEHIKRMVRRLGGRT